MVAATAASGVSSALTTTKDFTETEIDRAMTERIDLYIAIGPQENDKCNQMSKVYKCMPLFFSHICVERNMEPFYVMLLLLQEMISQFAKIAGAGLKSFSFNVHAECCAECS